MTKFEQTGIHFESDFFASFAVVDAKAPVPNSKLQEPRLLLTPIAVLNFCIIIVKS